MTYRFMRIIDDSLGMFLCRILGLFLRLKHLLPQTRRKKRNDEVTRILIQKYFGMGSILHAIPLIRVLRRSYPNARITFVTIGSNRELLSLCGLADDVLIADFSSLPSFLGSCVRIAAGLWTARFDISVDLEFFAKFPMLISAGSIAPIRVGLYHRKIRPEGILTHKVSFNFYRHISEIYLAYAVQLDLPVKPEDCKSVLPSFRQELEESLRSRLQLSEKERIVVVNVNSGDLFTFRKWPARSFVSLLGMLMDRHSDYTYVLIGAKSEHAYVDEITRQVGLRKGRLLNCAGRTTLKELFALIEMSTLVITNDSGPLHIASRYGKDLAAFFGPETPVVYGPVNRNALVFYPDNLYCSPCMCVYDSKQSLYAETCERNVCMTSVQPEQVMRALEERFLGAPVNLP